MNLNRSLFWTTLVGVALGSNAQASPTPKQTHPVQVTSWSDKPRYWINEPIHLGIKVLNTSKRLIELDYALDFHANVRVIVTDQDGKNVAYPDWNVIIDEMPRAGLEDGRVFMKLWPGFFFGKDNFTGDRLRLDRKGTYTVQVNYSGVAFMSHEGYPGHHVWDGQVRSPPIKIEIVEQDGPTDKQQ